MSKKLKRVFSAVTATALIGSSLVFPSAVSAEDTGVIFESEVEKIDGVENWTSIYETQLPGFSGDGFAYLTSKNIEFEVEAPEEGLYQFDVRYAQILSEEGRMQTIMINGAEYSKVFAFSDKWKDTEFGKFRLKKGTNKIALVPKYGYAAFDTITVKKAVMPDLKATATAVPCDKKATKEAKGLMKYLYDVYGTGILSGQQTIYGGGHKITTTIRYDAANDVCVDESGKTYSFDEADKAVADDGSKFVWKCTDENGQVYSYDTQNRNYNYCEYDRELKYLKETVGDMPAIQGFDFGANCPCYQWDDGIVERMIDWTNNKNGICTASWHINVPVTMADYTLGEPLDFSKTTYSEKCDFSPSKAMEKGTPEYDYWQLCIKNLAEQLSKLQDAGVPVLFRPLHEADGNYSNGGVSWFWWGKEGPEVYNKLWKYLQTELQETYGIHNLIWEQNLYAWSDASAEWYSGEDCVDIVGYDKYNTQYNRHDGNTSGPNLDAESGIFWRLYDTVDGKKMVAMPENDTIPSLDNITIEKAGWLYFCPWYDEESSPKFLSGEDYQNLDELKKIYKSDYCITLSELPKDWKNYELSDTPGDYDYIPGDIDGNKSVNIVDFVLLKNYLLNIDSKKTDAHDTNGDGKVNVMDLALLKEYLMGLNVKLSYPNK